MNAPEIIITHQDLERIERLLDVLPPAQRAAAEPLEQELARAQVVAAEQVPRDVVTMNSCILFEDVETGRRTSMRLVYPKDVANGPECISILAPVGSALLGLREGACIDWELPSRRTRRYRVLEVAYQPEAAGDFHL